ncbi:MAG: metallophosphoesterase [Sarcina sp.]
MSKSLLFIIPLALAFYSIFIERNLIRRKLLNINRAKNKEIKTLKIVHFTDVHLGKFFSIKQFTKIINKIKKEDPDIIIFTGDLTDSMQDFCQSKDVEIVTNLLATLTAKIGKFAVYGNHDSYPGNRYTYESIMTNGGFSLLKNESKKLNLGSKTINILGLDDFYQGKMNVKETVSNINTEDFNLLLLHEPDLIEVFKDYPIDLALAGHSHGGQIYIPLYGTVMNTGLAIRYDRGLQKNLGTHKQTSLYVNSGIGSTGLPIRFCCIPNISIINLTI